MTRALPLLNLILIHFLISCAPHSNSNSSNNRSCNDDLTVIQSSKNDQGNLRLIGHQAVSSAPSWSAHVKIDFIHPQYGPWELGCTGFLVAENAVLTAAHCLDLNITKLTVELNATVRGQGEIFETTSYTKHPSYRMWGTAQEPWITSDIGIIWLPGSTELTPVKLASMDVIQEAIMESTQNPIHYLGYGMTIAGNRNSTTNYLQEIFQQIKPFDHCFHQARTTFNADGESLYFHYQNETEFLCTDPIPSERTSACNGDSGGPLTVDSDAGPLIVGLTSFGPGSCNLSSYATTAAHFRSWLESQISSDIFSDGSLQSKAPEPSPTPNPVQNSNPPQHQCP